MIKRYIILKGFSKQFISILREREREHITTKKNAWGQTFKVHDLREKSAH